GQRKCVSPTRHEILEASDIKDNIRSMIIDTVTDYVAAATATGYVEDWDLEQLWNARDVLYGANLDAQELVDGSEYGAPGELTAEQLTDALVSDALEQYDDLEERISAIGGEKQMRDTKRMIILPVIDNKWASTCMRWTISRRASACVRWLSVILWW